MLGVEYCLKLCVDCGYVFHQPKMFIEKHGLDSPPYETTCGCPNCDGYYVTARTCNYCSNVITGEFAKINNGDVYCKDCFEITNNYD